VLNCTASPYLKPVLMLLDPVFALARSCRILHLLPRTGTPVRRAVLCRAACPCRLLVRGKRQELGGCAGLKGCVGELLVVFVYCRGIRGR
jgi:hypothetical protein